MLDGVLMYQNVVVLLDGSELAEGVLPHVVGVIRDRESRVHLLSVAPSTRAATPVIIDTPSSSADVQEQRQGIDPELDAYLWTVARRLESTAAEVQVNVRFGRPADRILAFVNEVDADLIAMSTHGRSGISRWVFGSVADRVLRGATCPVLLVRAGQVQLHTPYRRILVPLDGSELAEQVVPYVRALVSPLKVLPPERGDARVFLVSVLTAGLTDRTLALLTSYPPGLQLATSALDYAQVQLQSYLRSVAAVLREHGALVQIAVQRGSPADEILAYAARVEADLISMTTHGATGASRWAYGSVAGRILQGAHSPVLLVRPAFIEDGGNRV
jgi:nucleotide-binding universal stress UspA family protein